MKESDVRLEVYQGDKCALVWKTGEVISFPSISQALDKGVAAGWFRDFEADATKYFLNMG